jgi:2-methylcitrate dehydratase PrpD
MRIVQVEDVDPEKVEKIIIHATPRTASGFVGQPFEIGENPQVSGAFSIIYVCALAVQYKCVRPEYFNVEAMSDPELNKTMAKIEIKPSLPKDEYQTAECDIVMTDGTVYHSRCDRTKGDIYHNPMSDDEILDKFYKNIEFSGFLDKRAADLIVDKVSTLETLSNISELTDLMK